MDALVEKEHNGALEVCLHACMAPPSTSILLQLWRLISRMAVQAKKKRTPCDKSYSVADAMQLVDEMLGSGSRDLTAALAKLSEDWKSQPKPDVMMPFIGVTKSLARKCPSLLVVPSHMELAIAKLDEQNGPCNFTGVPRGKWSDQMSGKLRCLFSKWRRVSQEMETRRKFMMKLSTLEKEQVRELMGLVDCYMDVPKIEENDEKDVKRVAMPKPSSSSKPSCKEAKRSEKVVVETSNKDDILACNADGILACKVEKDESDSEVLEVDGKDIGDSEALQGGDNDGKDIGDTDGQEIGDSEANDIGDIDGKEFGDSEANEIGDTGGKKIGDTDGKEIGDTDGKEIGDSVSMEFSSCRIEAFLNTFQATMGTC